MGVIIRKGVKDDLSSVLTLIRELAEFENSICEVEITLEDLEKDGFGDRPFFWFLVAEFDNKIIGLSFYWIRYSTWKGKFLFLEDFIVKTGYRGSGVGSKLFEATIKICVEENLNGMMWQVLDWNSSAISFYKKYDANISSKWLNGKLSRKQLDEINDKFLF